MNHSILSTPPLRKQLMRNQNIQIIAFSDIDIKQTAIARQLKITRNKVRYTLTIKNSPTPSKRSGRLLFRSQDQVDEIEIFVISSRAGH